MVNKKVNKKEFVSLIEENQDVFSININKPTGILPAEFVFLSFPYRDPKANVWSREDKKKKIALHVNSGTWSEPTKYQIAGDYVGIPFGGYARLILMHIINEAKIKNTQIIDFGKSIDEMFFILGLDKSTKVGGTQKKALQEQWLRVSKCYMVLHREEENSSGKNNVSIDQMMFATNIRFWGKDESTQRYVIRISTEFFEYIKNNATIPYNKELIPRFLRNPMLIDLYLFFNTSAFWANRNQQDKFISFRVLYNNFGSQGEFYSFKQTIKKNIVKLTKILSGLLFVEFGEKNNEDGIFIKKQSQSNVRFDNQEYPILNFIDNN